MRVVIFWIMCHLSLGHEKKALLSSFQKLRSNAEILYLTVKPDVFLTGRLLFGLLKSMEI